MEIPISFWRLSHFETLLATLLPVEWQTGSAKWRFVATYKFDYPHSGQGFDAKELEKVRLERVKYLEGKGWHVAGSAWKISPEPHIVVEVSFVEIPIQFQEQFDPGSRPIRLWEKILLWKRS